MKTYGDLNLKKLAEIADLDFAHFTYGKNQCSCCYDPTNMPKKYWRNKEVYEQSQKGEEIYYTYILFKNSHNGSGTVTKSDEIEDQTYISYNVKNEKQMELIITELQNQLGSEYTVIKPKMFTHCIEINRNIYQ